MSCVKNSIVSQQQSNVPHFLTNWPLFSQVSCLFRSWHVTITRFITPPPPPFKYMSSHDVTLQSPMLHVHKSLPLPQTVKFPLHVFIFNIEEKFKHETILQPLLHVNIHTICPPHTQQFHNNSLLYTPGGPKKSRFQPANTSLRRLLRLLRQQHCLDVWQHATLCNCHARQQFVQLLVIPDCQLQVAWNDTSFLVVSRRVACQLQYFSCQVLHHGSKVHWRSSTDPLAVVAFSQQSMDSSHRELQSSPARPRLCLALCFSTFSTSRHSSISF